MATLPVTSQWERRNFLELNTPHSAAPLLELKVGMWDHHGLQLVLFSKLRATYTVSTQNLGESALSPHCGQPQPTE